MTLHYCFSECICVPFIDINGGVVPRECIDSDADLPDLLRHRRYPEFRACDDASVAITRAKKANQLGIEKRLSGTYVFRACDDASVAITRAKKSQSVRD